MEKIGGVKKVVMVFGEVFQNLHWKPFQCHFEATTIFLLIPHSFTIALQAFPFLSR